MTEFSGSVYALRTLVFIVFEYSNYKVFFHLWHGGGPNYALEYRNLIAEEHASWTSVNKKATVPASSKSVCPPLTGANAVPVNHGFHVSSSSAMEFSNFKSSFNSGRKSVFMRLESGTNGAFNHINGAFNHRTVSHFQAGILGPVPNPKRVTP